MSHASAKGFAFILIAMQGQREILAVLRLFLRQKPELATKVVGVGFSLSSASKARNTGPSELFGQNVSVAILLNLEAGKESSVQKQEVGCKGIVRTHF